MKSHWKYAGLAALFGTATLLLLWASWAPTPVARAQGGGTITGIPYGPSLPINCLPNAPAQQNPLFYLTAQQGAYAPGLYPCTAYGVYAPGGAGFSGQMTWSGFIAAPTTGAIFSNFIPTSQITIIRIQQVVGTAALGCATWPVFSVWNIGSSTTLASYAPGSAFPLVGDTGAISVSSPGGPFNSLGLKVTSAGTGCGTPPANLNLTVTYTMP